MAAAEPVAPAAPSRSPEEVRAQEAEAAPRAGMLALAAAVLGLIAGIAPNFIFSDYPRVFLVDALRDSAGQPIGREGLKTAQLLAYDDRMVPILLVALLLALSTLAIGYVLAFLHDAANARAAGLARFARPAAILGAIAVAIANIGFSVSRAIAAHDFAGQEDHSTKAAHDALDTTGAAVAGIVGTLGGLALAAAFVLIALAAMRVGLLTRFIGVLGAIVGALVVLGGAIGGSSFIVQSFWLLMVGALLIGRWPGGRPPAWERGEAVPWPTQQELREARERQVAARRGEPAAAAAPEDDAADGPSPATSRKKRKRRG